MAYRVFRIDTHQGAGVEAELNGFLRRHQVLGMVRQFVADGERSFWAFCVEYTDSPEGRPTAQSGEREGKTTRVDHREKMPPDEAAVYDRLRGVRRELAEAASVPPYMVFTNQQLADVVHAKPTTAAALERVEGVGAARVAKYGPRVLEVLIAQWGQGNEAGGAPVAATAGPG